MHESESRQSRRSIFQLTIGRLLSLLILIGLGLGWWSDHARLTQQLENSEIQREIQDRQIGIMRSANPRARLPLLGASHVPVRSSEQFVEMVRMMQSASSVSARGVALGTAKEHYKETIVRMLEMLREPEEHVRRNACLVLKEQYTPRFRDQMKSFTPVVTSRVIDVLELGRPDGEDTRCAIELLARIGPEAKEATKVLQSLAEDDRDIHAVYATIAIGNIRPEMDIAPRLIELIDAKNVGWQDAAIALMDHCSVRDVKDLLVKRYRAGGTKAEQDTIVDLMNRMGF